MNTDKHCSDCVFFPGGESGPCVKIHMIRFSKDEACSLDFKTKENNPVPNKNNINIVTKDTNGSFNKPTSREYCVNCKYALETNVCRRDLKTELHIDTPACAYFVKSARQPQDTDIVSSLGLYRDNAELALELQKVIPIYYDESKNFWAWQKTERYYKRIDETDILSRTHKESGKYFIDSTRRKELITAVQITGRERDVKSVNRNWIHAKDFVFDIVTKEQFKATPEYFYPSPIPHKIGLDERTPIIDKLFKEWMGDNATILYEICAYCLVDDYPIHRMFFLFGRGRNGKSQFLKLLSNLVGQYNTVSTSIETLLESRFEASKLYKKKIALIGETNFNILKNTDKLKRLTGDDLIGAEFKGKELFDFRNTAKILVATNSLPETLDKTEGLYSRIVVLEFKNQFDEGKSIIDTIPEVEYENLLLKCISMLPGLLERGKFTNEGTIEDKAKKYEKLSNPFPTFREKELIEDNDRSSPVWVLREMYEIFCSKNGFRKIGEREFTQLLHREGYETKKQWFGKKYWNTVFGLTTKSVFIYSEEHEKNGGSENHDAETDEPLKPHIPISSPYREEVEPRGLSGLCGLDLQNILQSSVAHLKNSYDKFNSPGDELPRLTKNMVDSLMVEFEELTEGDALKLVLDYERARGWA